MVVGGYGIEGSGVEGVMSEFHETTTRVSTHLPTVAASILKPNHPVPGLPVLLHDLRPLRNENIGDGHIWMGCDRLLANNLMENIRACCSICT